MHCIRLSLAVRLSGMCMGMLIPVLFWPSLCAADWLSVYETPAGSTSSQGNPVSARATFSFDSSTGELTILYVNLQSDPKAVNQNLSDLYFTFNTGETTGTLDSSDGVLRDVGSDGSYSDGATVSTGWVLREDVLDGLKLDDLGAGAAGPEHTIIGPPDGGDTYTTANASIKDNSSHNPFLAESATFHLTIPGLNNQSRVSQVTFSFDTTSGNDVTGMLLHHAPEPGSVFLAVCALVALAAVVWQRRSAS